MLRVSINGGDEPVWRADGRGLFYLAANGDLMDVDLAAANGALEIHGFRVLFHPPRLVRLLGRTQYAVTADGRRFLFNVVVPDTSPKAITVILN